MADDYFKLLGFSPSLRQRMRHEGSALPTPRCALPNAPAYDVDHHLAKVRTLWQHYPLRTEAAIDKSAPPSSLRLAAGHFEQGT